MQNAIFNPFSIPDCNPEEEKAFGDYLRKGIVSEFVTKSLSTTTGEAGVVIVNNLNNKIVSTVNAKSVMRQLASIETISTSALDFIIEDGKFDGSTPAKKVILFPYSKNSTKLAKF